MGLIKKAQKFPRKVKETYTEVEMKRFGLESKDVNLIMHLRKNKRR